MTNHQFIMKNSGRWGNVVYCEGDRRIEEIYWEISGNPDYDIGFWPIDLREWDKPKGKAIDKEHQLKILRSLRQWLKNQNIRSNIDLPPETTITDQPCVWADCSVQKIKGSAFCLRHHDLNLLR